MDDDLQNWDRGGAGAAAFIGIKQEVVKIQGEWMVHEAT